MPSPVRTECRLCESHCGLVVSRDSKGIQKLHPDFDHPVSRGYACKKGLRFHEVAADPARLKLPMLRSDRSAEFEERSWDDAFIELGDRLAAIRARWGPESIGLYSGNAAGHSFGTVLGISALQRGIGTTKHYSCLTLDNSEMFLVLEKCVGNALRSFSADYAKSDCIMLFGTDPLASQASQAQSNPGGVRELMNKASELIVVDPRRSATARKAGFHLQPRPGTDVFLLAALVREVIQSTPDFRDSLIEEADRQKLAQAVEPFTLERAAQICRLSFPEVRAVLTRLRKARRPLVWSGLGVLLGPHGTLGWWLTLCLQAVLGGIDRPGGWIHGEKVIDLPIWAKRFGVHGQDHSVKSRVRGIPSIMGTVAAATLADDILTPGEGQLRALICVGGNPAISLPDTPRAQQALASLELLVSIDLFQNDTGTLAHALLPAASWLERDEVALHMVQQRRRPYLKQQHAVTEPPGEAQPDWDILTGLCRAMGRPLFGSRLLNMARMAAQPTPLDIAKMLLRLAGRKPEALNEDQGLTGKGEDHGWIRAKGTDHRHGKLVLAVPAFATALATIEPPPVLRGTFQLITSVRSPTTLNTWLQRYATREDQQVGIQLHPLDIKQLGIRPGDSVRVRRRGTQEWRLTLPVIANAEILRGVAVLPFGWGHLPGAFATGGTNANQLIDTEHLEPFTGQPISNSLTIDIEAE